MPYYTDMLLLLMMMMRAPFFLGFISFVWVLSPCILTGSLAFTTPTPSYSCRSVRSYLSAGGPPGISSDNKESSSAAELLDLEHVGKQIVSELKEVAECLALSVGSLFLPDKDVTAESIVLLCDEMDNLRRNEELFVSKRLDLRRQALEFKRYELLVKLLRRDYDAYVATASFLSPNRIPRKQLPNVQDVPYYYGKEEDAEPTTRGTKSSENHGESLVADCELQDMVYNDNLLDRFLLSTFRKFVTKNTGGITSEKEGIVGLLDQGRTFMLQEGQTPEAQHKMVSETLGDLMTPFLPPFYRIFMSGIVPNDFLGTKLDGKQFGPWFYAPFLTSIVTPTFFAFLVGPSYPNRRKDGALGGLVVEKCKFLQESGCKGLCLHQCKLPAQEFFQDKLGLPLTVSPNFVTQECQWSFGEIPKAPSEDPSFPKGCLVGCESRKAMAGRYADICN